MRGCGSLASLGSPGLSLKAYMRIPTLSRTGPAQEATGGQRKPQEATRGRRRPQEATGGPRGHRRPQEATRGHRRPQESTGGRRRPQETFMKMIVLPK